MATQWGRRERVVWQPHMPLYTYAALAGSILCGLFFLWESYSFQQPEIRKAYTADYLRAEIGAQFHQHGKISAAHAWRRIAPGTPGGAG